MSSEHFWHNCRFNKIKEFCFLPPIFFVLWPRIIILCPRVNYQHVFNLRLSCHSGAEQLNSCVRWITVSILPCRRQSRPITGDTKQQLRMWENHTLHTSASIEQHPHFLCDPSFKKQRYFLLICVHILSDPILRCMEAIHYITCGPLSFLLVGFPQARGPIQLQYPGEGELRAC